MTAHIHTEPIDDGKVFHYGHLLADMARRDDFSQAECDALWDEVHEHGLCDQAMLMALRFLARWGETDVLRKTLASFDMPEADRDELMRELMGVKP